jgi:hypothetical protein
MDLADLTMAHGLSAGQARRQPPWTADGYPRPVNNPQGRRAALWDREQVLAYIAGEPVPALPDLDDPDDLLDTEEAAALVGLAQATWLSYLNRPRPLAPAPDATIRGMPHWRRSTLTGWQANRVGQGVGGGRPSRSGLSTDELEERVRTLLTEAAATGRSLSARAVSRELGISPTTASKLVASVRGESG